MRQSIGVYRNDISARVMSGYMYCFQEAVYSPTFTELFTTCVCYVLVAPFIFVLDAFAKLRKSIVVFVMSVSLSVHVEKNWLPMDRFSWNFVFEYSSKICSENSAFDKIGQEQRVLYMKTNIHFWSYLAQSFLKWAMFQTKVVQEKHILCSLTRFSKIVPFVR
jgi:hypothetical protein